jgi:hypothetical protein
MKLMNLSARIPAPDMVKVASQRVTPAIIDPERFLQAKNTQVALQRTVDGLLPLEADAKPKVLESISLTKIEQERLLRHRRIHEFSGGEYQILDIDVLKWRCAKTRLPIFAVFEANNSAAGFICRMSRPDETRLITPLESSTKVIETCMIPRLPMKMENCFRDIYAIAEEKTRNFFAEEQRISKALSVEVTLLTRFGGIIPFEVKEEWARAKRSGLFRRFFIIAEVVEWAWNKIVTSREGDPLLVGYDGVDPWLIKAFDTTSAERLVADEYATHPLLD